MANRTNPLNNIFEEWDEDCLVLTIDVTKHLPNPTKNGNTMIARCNWHEIVKKDGRTFTYILTVVEKIDS